MSFFVEDKPRRLGSLRKRKVYLIYIPVYIAEILDIYNKRYIP